MKVYDICLFYLCVHLSIVALKEHFLVLTESDFFIYLFYLSNPTHLLSRVEYHKTIILILLISNRSLYSRYEMMRSSSNRSANRYVGHYR